MDKNDTQTTEDRLSALEAEINESRAAIDKDFAKIYIQGLDEEKEQQLFSNPEAFLLDYEQAKLQHLEQTLAPKLQKHKELRTQLDDENLNKVIESAKQKLLKKYPKANPDEVLKYMQEDLSPKQLQSLNQTPPDEVLIKVYEMMPKQGEKELPEELNDLSDNDNLENNENEFMNRR